MFRAIAVSAAIVITSATGTTRASARREPQQVAQAGASRFALALVSDARGKAVIDIGADDFVVQEGSASREILDVRVADYPVVVVFDNSGRTPEAFASIKSAVTRFVERLGPRPLAIVTMGGAPRMIATFEDDRQTILERLEQIDAADAGGGQPLRAAALAAQAIRQTGALFSAIVVATASPVEGAEKTDELVAAIIDSGAVVHVVASDRSVEPGRLLRALSQQTHGDFTPIFTDPSFLPAMERFAVRLTTEMLIEYIVPVGSKAIDTKIGVRIPGARVRGLGVAPR